jgi:hypothetical protein
VRLTHTFIIYRTIDFFEVFFWFRIKLSSNILKSTFSANKEEGCHWLMMKRQLKGNFHTRVRIVLVAESLENMSFWAVPKGKIYWSMQRMEDMPFWLCKGDKQGGTFEANLKKSSIHARTKYNVGLEIMTVIDELMSISNKSQSLVGNDHMETQIYNFQITQYVVQYVKFQAMLDSKAKWLYALIIGQCMDYMIDDRWWMMDDGWW